MHYIGFAPSGYDLNTQQSPRYAVRARVRAGLTRGWGLISATDTHVNHRSVAHRGLDDGRRHLSRVALVHNVHRLVQRRRALLERLKKVELALLVGEQLLVVSHAHTYETLTQLIAEPAEFS